MCRWPEVNLLESFCLGWPYATAEPKSELFCNWLAIEACVLNNQNPSSSHACAMIVLLVYAFKHWGEKSFKELLSLRHNTGTIWTEKETPCFSLNNLNLLPLPPSQLSRGPRRSMLWMVVKTWDEMYKNSTKMYYFKQTDTKDELPSTIVRGRTQLWCHKWERSTPYPTVSFPVADKTQRMWASELSLKANGTATLLELSWSRSG